MHQNNGSPVKINDTQVSANYLTFVVYSTGPNSTVLMGDTDTTEESEPRVIPALQDRNVISVVLGDYHSAALTADGKLYTWGRFSSGALGLGDAEDIFRPYDFAHGEQSVKVPTEVRFDHWIRGRKDRFCLAIAAAGWHTGALVIDLEVSRPVGITLAFRVDLLVSLAARKRKSLSLYLHLTPVFFCRVR